MKFQLIREFLVLNVSVLLSDVDILTLKNPFEHLYRDEDVEALSDGFDKPTAYGEIPPSGTSIRDSIEASLNRGVGSSAQSRCTLELPPGILTRSSSSGLSALPPSPLSGWDDVFDDPKMGWSRWAHSFHAFSLNSGLFYIKVSL